MNSFITIIEYYIVLIFLYGNYDGNFYRKITLFIYFYFVDISLETWLKNDCIGGIQRNIVNLCSVYQQGRKSVVTSKFIEKRNFLVFSRVEQETTLGE